MGYAPPSITPSGFVGPTYQDILLQLVSQFLAIFGSTSYLGPDSSDYQDIAVRALQYSDLISALQAALNSLNPAFAVGTNLDLVGKLIGTARRASSPSTVVVTLSGTGGTTVNNGVVQDQNGFYWNLPSLVVIGSGGTVSVTATASINGNITANPGTVTTISTPTAGWTSVTNPGAAIPGAAVEPDSSYRDRLIVAQAKPSRTLVAGTAAAIAAVPGVTRSVVYENQYGHSAGFGIVDTSGTSVTLRIGFPFDSTDALQAIVIAGVTYSIASVGGGSSLTLTSSAGVQTGVPYELPDGISLGPPHSITAVVEGGVAADVAAAIYSNKNPGVLTNGTTTVTESDPANGGIAIPISFTVLSYVQVYVAVTVKPLNGFTSAISDAIAANVLAYLDSLGIGQAVIFSQIYEPVLAAQPNQLMPVFSVTGIIIGSQAAQTSATTSIGSPDILLTSISGIATAQVCVGAGIPANTTVSSITGGQATAETINAPGTGYSTATNVATTGGSGSGLTVDITATGGAITGAVSNALGSGYMVGDVVTVAGGTGGQLNIAAIQNTVVLSANATANASGVPVTFFAVGTSDIQVPYNAASSSEQTQIVVNS